MEKKSNESSWDKEKRNAVIMLEQIKKQMEELSERIEGFSFRLEKSIGDYIDKGYKKQ